MKFFPQQKTDKVSSTFLNLVNKPKNVQIILK